MTSPFYRRGNRGPGRWSILPLLVVGLSPDPRGASSRASALPGCRAQAHAFSFCLWVPQPQVVTEQTIVAGLLDLGVVGARGHAHPHSDMHSSAHVHTPACTHTLTPPCRPAYMHTWGDVSLFMPRVPVRTCKHMCFSPPCSAPRGLESHRSPRMSLEPVCGC